MYLSISQFGGVEISSHPTTGGKLHPDTIRHWTENPKLERWLKEHYGIKPGEQLELLSLKEWRERAEEVKRLFG